jgi:hypothetical protein
MTMVDRVNYIRAGATLLSAAIYCTAMHTAQCALHTISEHCIVRNFTLATRAHSGPALLPSHAALSMHGACTKHALSMH